MTIDYERISSAHITINGINKSIDKIYETINGVWVLKYSSYSDPLEDFNYTDNNNGTYTLIGWKGTLNGKSSTELFIPDDPRVIL